MSHDLKGVPISEVKGCSMNHRSPAGDSTYGLVLREVFDPEAIMDRLLDKLMSLVPTADGTLLGLADQSGRIRIVRTGGVLHGLVGASLSGDASLSGLAMSSGEVLRCDDAAVDTRVDRVVLEQIGMASLVSIPLARDGVRFGVVDAVAAVPHAFTDTDVEVCVTLAEFLAEVISLSADATRLFDQLGLPVSDRPRPCPIDNCSERVAQFVTTVLSPAVAERMEWRGRLSEILRADRVPMVFQPIRELASLETVAVEALARFPGPPGAPPDRWFAHAHRVGLGVDLEILALRSALEALPYLPADISMGVNLGPQAMCSADVPRLIDGYDAHRVVVELTEHAPISDYPAITSIVAALRCLGARLAVDDTGTGFSSLAHIVQLRPELVKLDRWITHGVDDDPVRQALVESLVSLATALDAHIVAEGIETHSELQTLLDLGVQLGQGYYLGRPVPLGEFPSGSAQIDARLTCANTSTRHQPVPVKYRR